jgi:hypothetical protein
VSAEPRSKGPQSDQKIAASARNKDKRSGTGEKLSRAEAGAVSTLPVYLNFLFIYLFL